jgi:protein-disulfide isomerase
MAPKRKPSTRSTASKTLTPDDSAVVEINIEAFLTPIAIFIAALMVSFSIIYSASLISKGESVLGSNNADTADTADTGDTAAPTTTTGTTSIDDDPILGNKSTAKVAIIEFSDYECPFCKRHFEQTYPQIKKDYIDTGKAILVFRDFPLSFHNPLATKEAIAAECVDDLGNDAKYFQYHDKLFTATTSNGNGLAEAKLYTLAAEVGINAAKFKSCLDSEKFKAEVEKDTADGSAAGIDGTPGFIVGVLGKDGKVEGVNISGAQPYATFKTAIEDQLAKAK